jgi:FkbM family methyltransferase
MFFDIGANVGNWSLENIKTAEKIVALEPDPDTFRGLKHNTEKHNIVALNYAVCSSINGEIEFYKCDANTLSTVNIEWLAHEKSRFNGHKYQKIVCKTITIDRLIELYGKPALIKVDVEGGEYECIKTLTQKVDLLCFEWASELDDISFLCLDHLQSIGFDRFYVQYEDGYSFRPKDSDFKDIDSVKAELNNTIKRCHWGMIWCTPTNI